MGGVKWKEWGRNSESRRCPPWSGNFPSRLPTQTALFSVALTFRSCALANSRPATQTAATAQRVRSDAPQSPWLMAGEPVLVRWSTMTSIGRPPNQTTDGLISNRLSTGPMSWRYTWRQHTCMAGDSKDLSTFHTHAIINTCIYHTSHRLQITI